MAKRTRRSGFAQAAPPESSSPAASAAAALAGQAQPPAEGAAAAELHGADPDFLAATFGFDARLFRAMEHLQDDLEIDLEATAEGGTRLYGLGPEALDEPVGLENILGWGLGFKEKAGFETPIPCVKVYVRFKVDRGRIAEGEVRGDIDGYPTDVEEIEPPELQGRPYPCGSACKPASIPYQGTIGCLCIHRNNIHFLTNNHVAAYFNRVPTHSQSANGSGIRHVPSNAWVGNLTHYEPLSNSNWNRIDGALVHTRVTPHPEFPNAGYLSPRHPHFSMNRTPGGVTPGVTTVAKHGVRTGYTEGTYRGYIRRIHTEPTPLGTLYFEHQMAFRGHRRKFSDQGDSGSVIVRRDTWQPVALLWAGAGHLTYASPIETVQQILGIDRFVGGDEQF